MPEENERNFLSSREMSNILLGGLALFAFGYLLNISRGIFIPLAVAAFLRFILDPIISFFEKRHVPSMISIILAITITTTVLVFMGSIVVANINSFTQELPKYTPRINALADNTLGLFGISEEVFSGESQWSQLSELLDDFSIPGVISAILGSVSKFFSNTFLVLLFLLFMLMGRNQLINKLDIAFEQKTAAQISDILGNMNQQIQKYLITKTLISLLTATLVMIVLFFFDVEFIFVWGILTFALNFVPNVGSVIATLLPLTVATIQYDDFATVLWLGVVLFGIQFVVGNILEPRLIGDSINLSPIVVLVALIFWGWLWGIIGMFLAIPMMVIIKIVLENIDDLKFLSVLMSSEKAA